MAFPHDPLPVVVEIAPGAAPAGDSGDWLWQDVTDSVSIADRGRITISEGRGNWGTEVDAGRCSLTFNNASGDFSQHNPNGRWYGQLGRDTPLRVRLRRAEDAFNRTATNGWGVADSGQAWSVAASTSEHDVVPGAARQSHSTLDNFYRRAVLDVSLLDVEQIFDVSTSALLTGGALVTGCVARHVDGSNYYWLRVEFDKDSTDVILKVSKRVAGATTDLAVLDPVPGLSYAAGSPLRVRAQVAGNHLAIKVWNPASAEPAGWHLEATDTALARPGKVGLQSWLLNTSTNALPVRASYSSYRLFVDLFGGHVPAWVPRQDKSGRRRWVEVTARGVLQRLQPASGRPPVRSSLTRYLSETNAVAWWPLDDGADSTQAASGLTNGRPMTANAGVMTFTTDGPPGSAGAAQPQVSAANALQAPLNGVDKNGWQVTVWTRGVGDLSQVDVYYVPLELRMSTGKILRLIMQKTSDVAALALYANEAATTASAYVSWTYTQNGNQQSIDGKWHLLQAVLKDNASTADVFFYYDGVSASSATWGETVGVPVAVSAIGRFGGASGVVSKAMSETQVAHIGFWNGYSYLSSLYDVGMGRPGEVAQSRLVRLCAEDNVPLALVDSAIDSIPMGAQHALSPVDLYRQCEAANGGILYERPFTLAFATRGSLYNQTPMLRLNAQTDPGEPLEPDAAGRDYRNRWTVRRIDGSSAVAADDEIAAGAIVYDDSETLSLKSDSQLLDQAHWRLHITTTDGLRWPSIDLNLAARPALIDQWLNCRPGSRITATNPPADVAGQDVDVLLDGHTTTLGHREWRVEANCSPATPWTVGVYGTSRYDTAGCEVSAAVSSTATTITVTTTSGPAWTTNAASMPFDLNVGGERVTVTAVAGTTTSQTLTVTRSVNGVVKSHATGTAVRLWAPAVVAL